MNIYIYIYIYIIHYVCIYKSQNIIVYYENTYEITANAINPVFLHIPFDPGRTPRGGATRRFHSKRCRAHRPARIGGSSSRDPTRTKRNVLKTRDLLHLSIFPLCFHRHYWLIKIYHDFIWNSVVSAIFIWHRVLFKYSVGTIWVAPAVIGILGPRRSPMDRGIPR